MLEQVRARYVVFMYAVVLSKVRKVRALVQGIPHNTPMCCVD